MCVSSDFSAARQVAGKRRPAGPAAKAGFYIAAKRPQCLDGKINEQVVDRPLDVDLSFPQRSEARQAARTSSKSALNYHHASQSSQNGTT
jgi:hypothetical protein